MDLKTYLKRNKIPATTLSVKMGHAPNWLGRIMRGNRRLTLLDAMGLRNITKLPLGDFRRYVAPNLRRFVR